jgi:single-stranded-DNA-specific exonuclease
VLTGAHHWQIADPVPDRYVASLPDLNPLVAQVLFNRGLTEPDEAARFLDGRLELDDPFQLLDMDRAVKRLRRAIQEEEPLAIYGDFDADGVAATALLVLTLRALGGRVHPYIPHRVDEGYGLNGEALTELAGQGVRVVVTVDCGIRSPDEVAHARRLGMDVIITDHHTVGSCVPQAGAVVNPRQPNCAYPCKHLAGVGLAYKLAQALLRTNQQVPLSQEVGLREEDLLDLVALGTVADLAPLIGENRSLVRRGLERLNDAPRLGIEELMRQARAHRGKVDATTIGYVLGPRINAAGRMAHAKIAYQLLVADYPEEAKRLAQRLDALNKDRRRLTAEVLKEARQMALAEGTEGPLLLIAGSDFPAGIVGLVAGRLMEEFYRPAVVVEQGSEWSKGSARSIPEFHITRALEACSDLLLRYGGHRAAAGFTVRTEYLPELKARLRGLAARELEGRELVPVLNVDASVPLREMTWELWEGLRALRPFGQENPEPVFVSQDVQVRHYRAVGADHAHLKLFLSDGRAVWDGIAFRQGEWVDRLPERIDIAYHLQLNEWKGEKRLQLNVQDIRPSGCEGEV